jgi:hypothetical protein
MKNLTNIIGFLFIITGCLDAIKYLWEASKVKNAKSAKTHSRKFINCALLNDIVKLAYGVCLMDIYIILTSIIAIFTMSYLWWQIFLWYPYKQRGLINFRRPNVFVYLINSILPNSLRRRL